VVAWLLSLGQALSAMSLYGDEHPARRAGRDRALDRLHAALAAQYPLRVTFLDDDVVIGRQVMHDLRGWELGGRLSRAGVQRIEIDRPTLSHEQFAGLLDVLHRALGPAAGPLAQVVTLEGVRLGPVGLVDDGSEPHDSADGTAGGHMADEAPSPLFDALLADGLAEELETMEWIHLRAGQTNGIPMAEVEAVVRGLALAMQAEQGTLVPLVALKSADQYTTVHACNVAMLSMGLAESLGFGSRDVRAVGTAALLHDIGKVRLPAEILGKVGPLTESERLTVQGHTIEGAKMLGDRGAGHALAAIVAYEHHIWANGAGGYPTYRFARLPHYVSRLVQVCDVYDALSTQRPYRDAWPRARTLHHMRLQAGRELDYDLLLAFFDLLDRAEHRQRHAGP
jgi:putative nucleotidyltransferase with HDIG domain